MLLFRLLLAAILHGDRGLLILTLPAAKTVPLAIGLLVLLATALSLLRLLLLAGLALPLLCIPLIVFRLGGLSRAILIGLRRVGWLFAFLAHDNLPCLSSM
jgi:hypothetical protein